ncbi:MAG TPA: hypothetical protein VN442_20910 [Bryobacteraceae bacterium]|nr:hypothetical protein [Bryobacteraceae bacterium]
MITLGTGKVYVNGKFETFQLFKTASAEKHASSDDVTLKTELIKGLNLDASKKQAQGGGVYRVKINDGYGYMVYKSPLEAPNTAAIFHYHWNYSLDLPLDAL